MDDEPSRQLLERHHQLLSLEDSEIKYQSNCYRSFLSRGTYYGTDKPPGRAMSEETNRVVEFISNLMIQIGEEGEFNLREMFDQHGNEYPLERTIQKNLLKKFGSNIKIDTIGNKGPVIFFKDRERKVEDDEPHEKRMRVED